MQLQFVGVDEEGAQLVLSDPDSRQEYRLAVDERLRGAVRPRPDTKIDPATVTPRQVQSMMRAGQTSAEIAELIGWPVERVLRFEGPILAEREHVARLAQGAHVRGRAVDGVFPTLGARVHERLEARGVAEHDVTWDAARPEGGEWAVLVAFVAGTRQRRAAWRFEPAGRTVEALDDEARWLSEDEQALPAGPDGSLLPAGDGSVDLVTTMRERSRARRRTRRTPTAKTSAAASGHETEPHDDSTASADPAAVPDTGPQPDQVLPLEDFPYDPDRMGPPPAAGYSADSDVLDDDRSVEADAGAEADDGDDGDLDADVEEYERVLDEAEAAAADEPREVTLGDFFGFDDDADDEGAVDEEVVDGADIVPEDDVEEVAVGDVEDDRNAEPDDVTTEADEEQPASSSKRKGRTSVPSWDDIMFGARGSR